MAKFDAYEHSNYSKLVPFISSFCFGTAVRKVQNLLAMWNQDNQPDWMIWKRLCNAKYAWDSSTSTFPKDKLNVSTPILRKRLNREKGIGIDIKEMQALKTAKVQKLNPYFTQDRFRRYLKIVIQQVAVELAKNHVEIYEKNEVCIHALELSLEDDELWIKIEWKEDQLHEQFCLKNKIRIGGIPAQFIDMLMKAEPNSMFPVSERSPADLIQRCNLRDGGLKELFFGDCTKRHVAFKGTRIERQSIKKEKLAELLIHLQRCHAVSGSPIRF